MCSPTTRISVITHSFFVCLRRLFFSKISQCFRLGFSMGSGVCFSHDAIQSGADSPTDEMKQEGWLRSLPLVWEVPCLMLRVLATLGLHGCAAIHSIHIARVSGIFGFPGAPKFILTMVAVQKLSKTIYLYKESSKRWWNAHLVVFQLLRSGLCLQKMCRYLTQAEAGNVTRPSAAPFSPPVL